MNDDDKRIYELKKLKLQYLQNESYRLYTPIGKFQEFTDSIMSDKYKVGLFEAANGVGKTFGMANLLANLFWPVQNKHFQQPLFTNWIYSKRGRICSYTNTVRETIIPTLKAVFPTDRYNIAKYETTKDNKRYESYWKTDTGFEFTIMTYDQDPKEFESANLGWFWEDEPPSYEIHQANYSRLRMGGVGFMTETPLKGSQWIFDAFIDKTQDVLDKELKTITTAALEDACEEHGVNGFITHQKITEQIAGYDPDEIEPRVYGKRHNISGRVFKKWTPEVHIIPPFAIDQENYVVVEALDSHPRTNDAMLWVAIDRLGRHFIIDELWEYMETSALVAEIKNKDSGLRIVKRIIEPAAFNVDKHTGYQLAADLSTKYALDFEPGSKDRQMSIQRTRDAIDFTRSEAGEIIRPPILYSFSTNERFNWEINRYQWQDWRGLTAQFKNPKEKPVDKDDHMIECLGRILLSGVQFTEMEQPVFIPDWARVKEGQPNPTNLDPYQ